MKKAKILFEKAEKSAGSMIKRKRVRRSSVQVDYYLQLALYEDEYVHGDESARLKYVKDNKKLYKFIIENGIYMNPDKPLPQDVDFTASPDLWHKLG